MEALTLGPSPLLVRRNNLEIHIKQYEDNADSNTRMYVPYVSLEEADLLLCVREVKG